MVDCLPKQLPVCVFIIKTLKAERNKYENGQNFYLLCPTCIITHSRYVLFYFCFIVFLFYTFVFLYKMDGYDTYKETSLTYLGCLPYHKLMTTMWSSNMTVLLQIMPDLFVYFLDKFILFVYYGFLILEFVRYKASTDDQFEVFKTKTAIRESSKLLQSWWCPVSYIDYRSNVFKVAYGTHIDRR